MGIKNMSPIAKTYGPNDFWGPRNCKDLTHLHFTFPSAAESCVRPPPPQNCPAFFGRLNGRAPGHLVAPRRKPVCTVGVVHKLYWFCGSRALQGRTAPIL